MQMKIVPRNRLAVSLTRPDKCSGLRGVEWNNVLSGSDNQPPTRPYSSCFCCSSFPQLQSLLLFIELLLGEDFVYCFEGALVSFSWQYTVFPTSLCFSFKLQLYGQRATAGDIRSQGVFLCRVGWNRQRQGVPLLFLLVLRATYDS